MNRISLFSVLFVALIASSPAWPDWVTVGVAARCDVSQNVFTLMPIIKTSDSKYDIAIHEGFEKFNEGANQHYQCDLGSNQLNMTISVYGPQAKGQGQGGGCNNYF